MSESGHHAEWLSLIEISGPFLAEPVLKEALPQGLEGLDTSKKTLVRQAYDEWRETLDLNDEMFPKIHHAWISLILGRVLELDDKGAGDVLTSAPLSLRHEVAEHGITLRPDFVVVGSRESGGAAMLICVYGPEVELDKASQRDSWTASPAERMVELCRATGTRLGFITNGERWMFVDAPVGSTTTFASWYARLWLQEPITLQAFVTLFGIRRFFGPADRKLPALLDKSLEHQDDVTDALGVQVRRAVELLVQALDREDINRDRELLKGIEPAELYEAGLTIMMRIVFLLSAEERGLLLIGDRLYEANYAVSSLRSQLRAETEEILERRRDAWSRLLSLFRAVYAGVDHEEMRLPALGGSLFDPDRYPFLEGRAQGSNWKIDAAVPLPIDNRTVLYLLDAVQSFQGRTLSYRALDVEQIGYVYEGLLEQTAVRAAEATLDLRATKTAAKPYVTLSELDDAAANGREAVETLLRDRSGSSPTRVKNDLDKPVDDAQAEKLLVACHGDRSLRDRIRPYFHFLRIDRWDYPLVYPLGAFMVTSGTDRRETGTHYTPKALTEVIVKETLEPIVYIGPAEGRPRVNWQLRTPAELLDLKICDPAMGSGAFLVQVCRWLGERLVDAWTAAEIAGKAVLSDGTVADALGSSEPLRPDVDERLLTARRLIAERCLYGVDMNPMAVELAKLSIWLVTLAKGRPFGFLDHNLRSGDSLLGITSLEQLYYLEMKPGKGSSKKLFASEIEKSVGHAIEMRLKLRARPIRDIRDVEAMQLLDNESRTALELPTLVADCLMGEILSSRRADTTLLSVEAGNAFENRSNVSLTIRARHTLNKDNPAEKRLRKPLHWPLEFPEVFQREITGFDAFVGNPPFVGGQLLSGTFGPAYQSYLVNFLNYEEKYSADLVVFFFLRCFLLLGAGAKMGLLARRSISEGKNREAGLTKILSLGGAIYRAHTNIKWPGKASVIVHQIYISRNEWTSTSILNSRVVEKISENLGEAEFWEPKKLFENTGRIFQGTILLGEGFKIDKSKAESFLSDDEKYDAVIFPFIGGHEVNNDPFAKPSSYVICFWDWVEEKARRFREAFDLIEANVKPGRQDRKKNGDWKLRKPLPQRWWQYGEKRPALYHAIGRGGVFDAHPIEWDSLGRRLERVLVISTGVTKYPAFTFLPSDMIYSNKLCVLADERYSMFALLSSDIHAVWAWFQKTSLGGDLHSLVYAHGNIFETFPFPTDFLRDGEAALETAGSTFFKSRQLLMEENGVGLTKFYNLFHNPKVQDARLLQLRSLQTEINALVVRIYGWTDLDVECSFQEVGYLPDGHNIRFTFSESTRLEIIRRLSQSNQEIHSQQGLDQYTGRPEIEDVNEDAAEHDLFGKNCH